MSRACPVGWQKYHKYISVELRREISCENEYVIILQTWNIFVRTGWSIGVELCHRFGLSYITLQTTLLITVNTVTDHATYNGQYGH